MMRSEGRSQEVGGVRREGGRARRKGGLGGRQGGGERGRREEGTASRSSLS